jgi:hypothetical protein
MAGANFFRVDTCTGLLPEHKPRYVMGVVGFQSPFSASLVCKLTLSRDTPKISSWQWLLERICLIVYGQHEPRYV